MAETPFLSVCLQNNMHINGTFHRSYVGGVHMNDTSKCILQRKVQ